ncbi:MAG: transporter substrate-binding domain-containing protein [Halopseudomonas aestusnigri]
MKLVSFLVLFLSLTTFITTANAVEFIVDPQISNTGPIIKLATSDLPKEKLVAVKGGMIDWDRPGIRIEQLRKVAEMVGVRFAYSRLPWLRALKVTQDGKSDAVFVTGYTEERTAWGVYPFRDNAINRDQALSKVVYWLYTKQGSQIIWNGEALSGPSLVIGAGVGDFMSKKLRDEGYNVIEVKSYGQLATMLEKGRIDVAVGFRSIIDEAISKNPSVYPSIVKHDIPLKSVEGYLVFSKKFYKQKPEITDNIWRAIAILWGNGTMDQLFKKYNN